MEGHRIILKDFLSAVKNEGITGILDAGSGRTSLSVITDMFPHAPVDAVVYPGDVRKIDSIMGIAKQRGNINIVEKDICSGGVDKEYDLVVSHLLLGEAAKFGNSFDDLLEKVFDVKCRYLVIIDYLEDPVVDEGKIAEMCEKNGLTVIYRSYFTNEQPQVWEDFTGTHNFGYLIKRA